jgi:SAM-dependent methyltransferase
VHAINTGVKLGFFDALAAFKGPIPVSDYLDATRCNGRYFLPWLRAVQSAGIINISDAGRVTFGEGWQEALTDRNSSDYIPPMLDCHLGIVKTYTRFPAIFRGKDTMPLAQLDKPLLSAIAEDGIRFANFFLNTVVDAIPGMRVKLEEGGTVVDVGCGGGKFLVKVAQQFPESRFVGIDQLPEAISIAKSIAGENEVADRVEFHARCATNLPSGPADCVILNEVLHEMEPAKRQDALMECRSVLKDGGVLFIVDILAPDDENSYARKEYELSALVQFFESPWGSSLLTRGEMRRLLDRAGFGEMSDIVSADNIVAGYVQPR